MSGTGGLSFSVPSLGSLAVPIELTSLEGFVKRNLLSSAIANDLPAGEYEVVGELPNGQQLGNWVTVKAGETTHVVLHRSDAFYSPADDEPKTREAAAASEDSPLESVGNDRENLSVTEAPPRRLAKAKAPTRRAATKSGVHPRYEPPTPRQPAKPVIEMMSYESLATGGPDLSDVDREVAILEAIYLATPYRVLSGNLLDNKRLHERQLAPADGDKPWTIRGTRSVQLVEVPVPGTELNLYVMLPALESPDGAQVSCTLEVDLDPTLAVNIHLQQQEADLLLGYDAAGMARQARTLASGAWDAERLLQGKLSDPIAAAVGAYSLLRSGDVERLDHWSGNLCEWVPWLPDGLVIYAEHLALVGRHDEAFRRLLDLRERGLPLFSAGLSKALGRLRFYLSAKVGTTAERRRARTLVSRLQTYASNCVFTNPFTNFTAKSPRPD